ncbi:LodA/GoxA family CTQ-dependent oxidase [Reichenbachiella sp. MSK19-1]|uniref:LodA/GoxA family CTQ-dependent oxidase n=1 Tax=Reichenbachiella sp. MSK19-1 TaxID=1897631 RepID=UPI000E6C9207|nr:LodA/GoxA family CTQ-dependent oxidase [Reichenbachiella sp. MSK19-1]RJE74946.1 hypothetical protein BGP76_17660 [Reichenbachiella sp. MSK19-1]
MSTKYKIHPAIGIARVGDSESYYIAPSTAGALPTEYSTPPPAGVHFRDASDKLLRQAAKFQVYAYESGNAEGTVVTAGTNGIKAIKWTAWIANKKSSWFQFMQQTGSGMGPYVPGTEVPSPTSAPYVYKNDLGYQANNANNPYVPNASIAITNPGQPPAIPTDNTKPTNPLRFNLSLNTSNDPNTMADASRQPLILDPGPITLTGPSQSGNFDLSPFTYPFLSQLQPFPISTLGSAQTNATGDLIVLGGFGNSGTTNPGGPVISAYANNEGWFDDIADGPVTAVLVMDDGSEVPVDASAWVSVGPPAYAPEILNQVNLYDDMYDIFVRELNYDPSLFANGEFQTSYVPNYFSEILPILERPEFYQYVAAIPSLGTTNHRALLEDDPQKFASLAVKYLRGRGTQGNPEEGPAENQPRLMPLLAGDNPISNFTASKFLGLTATQFFFLTQFADGKVDKTPPTPLPAGAALDRANLDNCVGGAFCPGIEITWITRNTSMYKPLPFGYDASDLFRIQTKDLGLLEQGKLSLTNGADNNYSAGLEPGDLSKYMAQPWQADFNECSIQNINPSGPNKPVIKNAALYYWWWPAQRPYSVTPKGAKEQVQWTRDFVDDSNQTDVQMVTCWKYLGFVMKEGSFPGAFEVERLTSKIKAYEVPSLSVEKDEVLKKNPDE